MVGSDVGERTLITRETSDRSSDPRMGRRVTSSRRSQISILRAGRKAVYSGAAMYDPLAVGTAIDPSLVTLKEMHVDVETKGEFTRGETVANRMGSNENNVLHGDHYEIEGSSH